MSAGRDPAVGRVVVVGSANVDLVVDVPRHPAGGETILGGDLRRSPGGKGANQAVGAARAGGAGTTFVGALGQDESAELLLASLVGAGVRTDIVERVGSPTGTALITVSPDGENAIVVAPGANSHVHIGGAQKDRIIAADVVLAQLEIPLDAVVAAARARRDGALFVLNAAPSRELPDELWQQLDVLVVNEHEAADLVAGLPSAADDSGTADAATPEALAAALLRRVRAVVVTLGGQGSLVARRGVPTMHVLAAQVTAVDTTGAGDTYCGVLAAALARGADLVDAARLAGAAGALAVTRPGAQDAVPEAADVAALAEELREAP
ncbi:ribokinase [Promicromonospora umidemergens]|uniref:Ribokinase n=1 Tax=Promicromonospora umidemergens TaxID=629679 RepID=A0ABP8X8Q4_9MICO|nr:ribokinase [Promicromonospora umidemergens]MCP2281415.1 ribokinase [Promicromonospora umidemergens]